jgi:hypothetical protein
VRRRTIVDQSSMTGRRILPLVVDSDSWVDIDSVAMLEYAEFLIRSGRITPAAPRRVAVAARRT